MLIICMYVDDLIFTSNDLALFENFKQYMKLEFDMNDLGLMYYYLGMEVVQSTNGILFLRRNMCKKF